MAPGTPAAVRAVDARRAGELCDGRVDGLTRLPARG